MSDRPETGPMKFGDDWTGIFIRGDNAFGYALALERALEIARDDIFLQLNLRGLMSALFDCDERQPGKSVQQMKPFTEARQ